MSSSDAKCPDNCAQSQGYLVTVIIGIVNKRDEETEHRVDDTDADRRTNINILEE